MGGPDSPPENAPNKASAGSVGNKRMKLYIDQPPGDGVSCRAFKIYNERGEKLIGVTSASVHHDMNDCARIDISLVVNGTDIVFGKPPALQDVAPNPPQRPAPSEPFKKA